MAPYGVATRSWGSRPQTPLESLRGQVQGHLVQPLTHWPQRDWIPLKESGLACRLTFGVTPLNPKVDQFLRKGTDSLSGELASGEMVFGKKVIEEPRIGKLVGGVQSLGGHGTNSGFCHLTVRAHHREPSIGHMVQRNRRRHFLPQRWGDAEAHVENKSKQQKSHLSLVMVWLRNVSHRFMHLNTCSPTGGPVWGDYGTFMRWSLAGGTMAMGWGALKVYSLMLLPVLSLSLPPFLSASCVWMECDQPVPCTYCHTFSAISGLHHSETVN